MCSSNRTTLILGAGLAGLAAGYYLQSMPNAGKHTILEKESQPGGLCRTDEVDGFLFDRSGHFLHLKDPEIAALVRNLLGDNLKQHVRNSWIYSHGTYSRYPFQANLYGLPPEEKKKVKQVPASLDAVLYALETDHEFLLKGDVFTEDVIETWISYKMENEVQALDLRPHPWEFALYYDA